MYLKKLWRTILFAPVLPILGADGGAAGSSDGGTGDGAGDGKGENNGSNNQGGNSEKTFTQAEVNALMAKEKKQGRSAALKALGFEDEKGAKETLEALRKLEESQKTDSQKKEDDLKNATAKAQTAESRAQAAERKLEAIKGGVKPEFVEEVTALALLKVSDDVDFETALKAVKEKMPTFFGEEDGGDNGTGSSQGHQRKNQNSEVGSFGASLAKTQNNKPTSNPYFSN